MTLIKKFESTGAWLFRWRSYFPLTVFGIILLALRENKYPGLSEKLDQLWENFCLIISFLGLGIRIITVGHIPKGTSGRNAKKQRANTLNITGMYSIVRNPMYLGNLFIGLGIALFAHIWWLIIIYLLAFWLYYERIILAEELYLRNKFGTEFLQWANVTPAFVPKFSNYRRPNLSFSLKAVLRREYNGFFTLIVAMFSLEVVGDLIAQGRFDYDIRWLVLVSAGFIIWVTLLTLKKHTTILNEEGR